MTTSLVTDMNTVKQVGKLFSLSSSLPQRPQLSFNPQEIIDDIDLISSSEEYRNKLYISINEKPPRQEQRFLKIQEFLQGTQDLEEVSVNLQELSEKACLLQAELSEGTEKIKSEIREYFEHKSSS